MRSTRLPSPSTSRSTVALRRGAVAFAMAALVVACGGSRPAAAIGPTQGTCGAGCKRSCDERCSLTLASCEGDCDAQAPLDLGNTEKQSPAMQSTMASCRRSCGSVEQNCLRTCNNDCRPCS